MEKRQKHNNRIYCSVFKEEIHFIIIKSNQNFNFQSSQNHFIYKKLNFLKIKRDINKIHYSEFSKNINILFFKFFNINCSKFSILFILIQIIFLFCFDLYTYDLSILEEISSLKFSPGFKQQTTFYKNTYLLKRNTSINTAFHRIFLFLEHNSKFHSSIINGEIDSYIHPELIIRILRKYLGDICMLHVLRNIFLCQQFFLSKEQVFSAFYSHLFQKNIFNILSIEIDNYSILKIIELEEKLNTEYRLQNKRINFFKWKKIEFQSQIYNISNHNYIKQLIIKKTKTYIVGLYAAHYLRNELSFLWLIDGHYDLKILLYRRLNRFLKRRMNIDLLYNQNYLTNYFHYSNFFIQIKMREITLNIVGYILNHKIFMNRQYNYIAIETYIIIEYLYSFRICTRNGYPIIKLNWTSLNDSTIIRNFQRIYENVLFFFSGIMNHKVISYCYHIINDSCLKTLAGKHKTNIRSILLEYNGNSKINLKLYKNSVKFTRCLLNPLNSIIKIRTWHIDIINQDIS